MSQQEISVFWIVNSNLAIIMRETQTETHTYRRTQDPSGSLGCLVFCSSGTLQVKMNCRVRK